MKLAPDHRALVDEIIEAAHGDGELSRDIAACIVDEIEDLERFGHQWSDAFLRELAIKGAGQLAREWRRSQVTVTETAKGTKVPLPRFAAVRTDDGYRQVRLADMTAAELRAHRERLAAQRNTLSKEVQHITDLLSIMDKTGALTAGEAERINRERAA